MFFWKRKTEEQSSTSLPLVQGKGDFQQGEHSGNRPWRLEASRQESARPGAGGHMTLYDMRMDGCVLGLPAGPWEHRSNPARTRPVVYPPIPRDLRGGERQVLQLTGKKRHTEEIACPTSPSLGFGGGPGGSGPSGGRTEVTPGRETGEGQCQGQTCLCQGHPGSWLLLTSAFPRALFCSPMYPPQGIVGVPWFH